MKIAILRINASRKFTGTYIPIRPENVIIKAVLVKTTWGSFIVNTSTYSCRSTQ